MAARVHRQLNVIGIIANGIWRQGYELRKRLQDLHIDVILPSETHLKSCERFCIPNYHFFQTDGFPGRKDRTAVPVRKGIPHNDVELPPRVSIETLWGLHNDW
jgi:hypothetical protein